LPTKPGFHYRSNAHDCGRRFGEAKNKQGRGFFDQRCREIEELDEAMKILNVLLVVVAILMGALVVINWTVLVTPIDISFGIAHVNAPFGFLLLGFAVALCAVFVGYLLTVQLGALSAARKHAAELRQHREIADTTELSRATELRQYLQQELESIGQAQRATEQRLHDALVATTNTLAACIGEVDDRLDRRWGVSPEPQA
jgi:hypothetical protein